MKKVLLYLTLIFFITPLFAGDEKPERFFEDQPDVTDDHQIHFNYLLAADSEDREWDINGKMEKILLEINEAMAKATAEHKKGDGAARKYKFDYRADGKLDITFIRMDMKHKELQTWANNDIIPFLNKVKGQKNVKKHYYNFADFSNVDGGEAGVGYGTTYLKSRSNGTDEKILLVTLHELHHSMGGGYNCVPGMGSNVHYADQNKKGDGVARNYKFDYRADGKLDITFIRMDMKHKELEKWANNDIIPFLNNIKDQKNIKKIYYNLADFSNVDGGEAGVGYGTTYLKSVSNGGGENKILVTLH